MRQHLNENAGNGTWRDAFKMQTTIQLAPKQRGFHLVTQEIMSQLNLPGQTGLLNLFLQHTSASLTLNENADPDVPVDLENSINAIVPEDFAYTHTLEGPDDMPAHVKASLLGSSVTVPVSNGRLALGTWQGIYLCEHRDRGTQRHLLLTLWGAAN